MTMKEASEHYGIPIKILKEYEKWGLCGAVKKVMGEWQIDAEDLERLSLIMTLHDSGFNSSEEFWFSHIAVEVPGEETKNEWCEPVDDEAYGKL